MSDAKITDPSEPIDYRIGGETWDSWALKYMATIPYIFRVLNAINGTDDTGVVLPLPAGAGAIVRKNADGTVTINVNGNATSADKLSTARTINITGKAQGSTSFDGSGDVTINVSAVSGNAESIVGKAINQDGMVDGTIPVYRASSNTIEFEQKGAVGAGKTLTISNGADVLGTYSGDATINVDIGPAIQRTQPRRAISAGQAERLNDVDTSKKYAVGDVVFDGAKSSNTCFVCVAASI